MCDEITKTLLIDEPKFNFGQIRVRNVERGVNYPKVPGYANIPAWSRGAKPWCELSPFVIGPLVFEEDGVQKTAHNFENFWQSFKVYSIVDRQNTPAWRWPSEVHVEGADKLPNSAWLQWHNALISHEEAVRHPNGRNIPLYAWWQKQKLNVIEARKEIYIPYLQKLYRAHPVYKRLLQLVARGQNIIILEPDGPTHQLYPDGMPVTLVDLYRLQNVIKMSEFPGGHKHSNPNKYIPYGHGYVIALTLLEDLS